ncbi:MAG: hypothetical protein WC375_09585, partial [Methanomassiliicoccales archaeon]
YELFCGDEVITAYRVRILFNKVPIWSIDLKPVRSGDCGYESRQIGSYEYWAKQTNIVVVGANLIASNTDLDTNLYRAWEQIAVPNYAGTIRKVVRDAAGDYWIATSNGVMVSRRYQSLSSVDAVSIPHIDADTMDLVEGFGGVMYCASGDGVFKTSDGGTTWDKLPIESSYGFTQIARDYTLDVSDVIDGHYHKVSVNAMGDGFLTESIGSGERHVHSIIAWDIQSALDHSHSLVLTLYAVDSFGAIYVSNDTGDTWSHYADMPFSDSSSLFACFGAIVVSNREGLHKYSGVLWEKCLSSPVFSYSWNYNMDSVFMGGNNIVYKTDDLIEFTEPYTFSGNPSVMLVKENTLKYFGYAYSNISQSFFFPSFVYSIEQMNAMIDFAQWYASGGSWGNSSQYDIFVDDKRVISTKYNEDKRNEYKLGFVVQPADGMISFSTISNVMSDANVYADSIMVDTTAGLYPGDVLLIAGVKSYTEGIDIIANGDQEVAVSTDATMFSDQSNVSSATTDFTDTTTTMDVVMAEQLGLLSPAEEASAPLFYSVVSGVSGGGVITLDRESPIDVSVPGIVRRTVTVSASGEVENLDTVLIKDIAIGDKSITVASNSFFNIGNGIVVYKDPNYFSQDTVQQTQLTSATSQSFDLNKYDFINAVEAEVRTTGSNEIIFASRLSQPISKSSVVFKVPPVNSETKIMGNIYDPAMTSVGKYIHEDIEDALSICSDGRAYGFNNVYLSNLLQLTQAIRYAHPEIGVYYNKNSLFYDFHYAWTDTDPVYPSIDQYIDRITTDIYNQSTYSRLFTVSRAKLVNRIIMGIGAFEGTIIVATDLGIFWAPYVQSAESNWFYVSGLAMPVYDVLIVESQKILACTPNGTYSSLDMVTWTLEDSPSVLFPSYTMSLRWLSGQVIQIPVHDARFYNEGSRGAVHAESGTPYNALLANRGIEIKNASGQNGHYIIDSVDSDGSTFWVRQVFGGVPVAHTNVQITMASWWQQWDGSTNTMNENLTNTVIVGGKSRISFANVNPIRTWHEAKFDASIGDFASKYLLPISSGSILCAVSSLDPSTNGNKLLRSYELGYEWESAKNFDLVNGVIIAIDVTDDNNAVLKVVYDKNTPYENGSSAKFSIDVYKAVSIGRGLSDVLVYTGNVIWNYQDSGIDYVVVYTNALNDLWDGTTEYTFRIRPFQVNTIAETYDNSILFGTDHGLYSDEHTIVSNLLPNGKISDAGVNGICSSVDIQGSIMSVSANPVNSNVILSVAMTRSVANNSLVGKSLYVTDLNPVSRYFIVSNTMKSVSGETTIEISTKYNSGWLRYVTKRFTIVGNTSLVYVTTRYPVLDDQLVGGTLYVLSDANKNYGKLYSIIGNRDGYIEVQYAFKPASRNLPSGADKESDIILSGQPL